MNEGISGESRKIQLRGGGSLSVRLEGVPSWRHFGEDERVLMSAIIDVMHVYEQKRRDESPSVDAVDPVGGDGQEGATRDTV